MADKPKIAVTLATLESRLHEANAIKTGIKLFNDGKVKFGYDDEIGYIADVDDKTNPRRCSFRFTRDGLDIESSFCQCGVARDGVLCKHIVAGILAVQGGIPETRLVIGKTASVKTTVDDSNTAMAMQSGTLPVFATPSMVALMERAACECLLDCLEDGQTSVGSLVNIEHTAASPCGTEITATATIACVSGRKIEFDVTANDKSGEIGKGKHTRIIVDTALFMKKAESR
jgi:predicted thioesterase